MNYPGIPKFINLSYVCFRQSSTRCTNTSQDSIWCVLVIFCNYPTQPSELMYFPRPYLLLWQHIRTRRSPSSKLITTPLLKGSETQEPESHKKSKWSYAFFLSRDFIASFRFTYWLALEVSSSGNIQKNFYFLHSIATKINEPEQLSTKNITLLIQQQF